MLGDADMVLGVLTQRHGDRCVAVLAAGQVDGSGSLNSSWTDRGWLTGSGGANDIATGAGDVVVLVPHLPGRLVEQVSFVTCPGHNVRTIVTDECVMRRASPEDPFVLTHVHVASGSTADAVRRVREQTPWPLRADRVRPIPPPTKSELAVLGSFDPRRHFLG